MQRRSCSLRQDKSYLGDACRYCTVAAEKATQLHVSQQHFHYFGASLLNTVVSSPPVEICDPIVDHLLLADGRRRPCVALVLYGRSTLDEVSDSSFWTAIFPSEVLVNLSRHHQSFLNITGLGEDVLAELPLAPWRRFPDKKSSLRPCYCSQHWKAPVPHIRQNMYSTSSTVKVDAVIETNLNMRIIKT
jgi:hypothetical protein